MLFKEKWNSIRWYNYAPGFFDKIHFKLFKWKYILFCITDLISYTNAFDSVPPQNISKVFLSDFLI